MGEILTPEALELLKAQEKFELLLWLGGIIVVSLVTALGVVWKQYLKSQDYIKTSDKANMLLIQDLTVAHNRVGADTRDTKKTIHDHVHPNLAEVKLHLEHLIERLK